MRRNRWLVLGIAAYTALVAGAWGLERRARHDAETARDRAVADAQRLRDEARRRDAARKRTTDPTAPRGLEERPAPAAPLPAGPAPHAAGPDRPAPDPADRRGLPPGSGSTDAHTERIEKAFSVDDRDAEGSFTRLLLEWDKVARAGDSAAMHAAWNALVASICRLIEIAPDAMAGILERRLRDDPQDPRLRDGLFEWLELAAADRAGAYVREALARSDSRHRIFGAEHLTTLPEAERIEAWDRLLRDRDPEVRQVAISYIPGDGPQFSEVLEIAAQQESDPARRGEMLAMAFDSNPTPHRLEPLLREVDRSRDTAFRRAVIQGLDGHLTPRDSNAVALLRRIALDEQESAEVRDAAFSALLEPASGSTLLDVREQEEYARIHVRLLQSMDGE